MDFTKLNQDFFSQYSGTKKAYKQGYFSIRLLMALTYILSISHAFTSIGWSQQRGSEEHNQELNRLHIVLDNRSISLRLRLVGTPSLF